MYAKTEKRKRGQNFSSEEKEKLVKLIQEHKTILNKKTDARTNEAKMLSWVKLTDSFNTSGSVYRPKESLLKVWEKMKSESKCYFNQRKMDGCRPLKIKKDPLMEQVCKLISGGNNDADDSDHVYESDGSGNAESTHDERLPKMCVEDMKPDAMDSFDINFCNEDAYKSEEEGSDCKKRYIKKTLEELQYMLLKRELHFKDKIYSMQLQAAEKDVIIKDLEIEIKRAILENVRGRGSNGEQLDYDCFVPR